MNQDSGYVHEQEQAAVLQKPAGGGNDLLRLVAISKSFPGVRALHNVHMELRKGEVHALIGELGTLTAAAVARGEKVEAFVNTSVDVVTKDNVKDFLK